MVYKLLDNWLEMKIRFEHDGNLISIEDLYDFTKEELNLLYKKYNKQYEGEGLYDDGKDETINAKLQAIKHVYEYKLEQEAKNKELAKRKEIKERLFKVLEERQVHSLNTMTKEELENMLNALKE